MHFAVALCGYVGSGKQKETGTTTQRVFLRSPIEKRGQRLVVSYRTRRLDSGDFGATTRRTTAQAVRGLKLKINHLTDYLRGLREAQEYELSG
jgi:hypothetical protein